MITGISHVVLRVRDLSISRAAYVDTLGLQEVAAGIDSYGLPACTLGVGSSLLELHQDPTRQPARDPATGKIMTSMDDNRCWIGHFALPVVDAIALHRRLAERGIAWTREPSDQPPGLHLTRRRLLQFVDPDYLIVQFAERIDEEGNPIPPAHADYLRDQPWPGLNRFDHFMVNTPVMDTKRAFYTEVLGLSAGPVNQTRLGTQSDLAAGDSVIELVWREAAQAPLHAGVIAALGLFVADLDGAYGALRERGVDATAPALVSPVTGLRRRIVSLHDLDGLPLELVQTE